MYLPDAAQMAYGIMLVSSCVYLMRFDLNVKNKGIGQLSIVVMGCVFVAFIVDSVLARWVFSFIWNPVIQWVSITLFLFATVSKVENQPES